MLNSPKARSGVERTLTINLITIPYFENEPEGGSSLSRNTPTTNFENKGFQSVRCMCAYPIGLHMSCSELRQADHE